MIVTETISVNVKRELHKGIRKLLWIMNMFIILIAVMVSQMFTYFKCI